MFGFPADTWALVVVSVAPGMALALWNARRVRRMLAEAESRPESRPESGGTRPPGR